MLAKQYSFTLPADYDMGIIRDRVAERGSAFDEVEHLGMKAFLIAEKDKHGAHENVYAPFYVWASEQGMLDFLCSDKFDGLTRSFGWPAVKVWTVVDFAFGKQSLEPKFATRELIRVMPHTDLRALREAELAIQQDALKSPKVHARVVALDPHKWELVRFTLWEAPVESTGDSLTTRHYEVLHLSAPMVAATPEVAT